MSNDLVLDAPLYHVGEAGEWRCDECGSTDVQMEALVHLSTGKVIVLSFESTSGHDWCRGCEEKYGDGSKPRLTWHPKEGK